MIFVLVIEHNFSLCHNSHTTVCFYLWNTGLVTGLATAPPPTPPPLKNIWKWQKTSRCNFLSYFFFCNAKTQRGLFHRFLKQVVNLSCYHCRPCKRMVKLAFVGINTQQWITCGPGEVV